MRSLRARICIVLLDLLACGRPVPPRVPAQLPPRAPTPIAEVPVAPAIPLAPPTTWRDAPPAPLDVVRWLEERDCIAAHNEGFPCVVPAPEPTKPVKLPRLAVRRITGPAALDAELESVTPLLRECYRRVASGESAPALTLTLLERRAAPLLVARVEPPDAPVGLVQCVADVFGQEIVQPLGAASPMVVTMGPVPRSERERVSTHRSAL